MQSDEKLGEADASAKSNGAALCIRWNIGYQEGEPRIKVAE